jgi:protein-disulfide isomerase
VAVRADLDSHRYRDAIRADMADARVLGVTGTPTFFVNGRPIRGNQPLRVFVDVVEQELARAKATTDPSYEALVGQGRPTADTPDADWQSPELDKHQTYRVGLGLSGHQLGPDDALVTLVVWSDFQCPYCARFAPVLAKVRAHYGANVRIVFRHLPMGFHKRAALAAEAAVAAADQGKFWAFHDQVFAQPGELSRIDLERFATTAGVELGRFRAALDDRRYRELVAAETANGLALGITGTPTTFINGTPLVGAQPFELVSPLIEAALARATAAVKAGIAPGDLYAVLMSDGQGAERADPLRIPSAKAAAISPRADDLARSVIAACRRYNPKAARELAKALRDGPRRRAVLVCAALGTDLP